MHILTINLVPSINVDLHRSKVDPSGNNVTCNMLHNKINKEKVDKSKVSEFVQKIDYHDMIIGRYLKGQK